MPQAQRSVFGVDRTPNTADAVGVQPDSSDLVETLIAAINDAELPIIANPAGHALDRSADLWIDVGGKPLAVQVKRLSSATPGQVQDLVRDIDVGAAKPIVHVLISDRIAAASRRILREHGWSWLDLRGHLHLVGPGLFVDTTVAAHSTMGRPRNALYGGASVEVACEIMLKPKQRLSVRDLARTLGRSPSTISEAMSGLREHGLISEAGTPMLPALFWETAEVWQSPLVVDLARQPGPDPRLVTALRLNFTDPLQSTGWALTDSKAAAAYGAPIALNSAYPPDFYVPDRNTAQRAVHLLGQAMSSDTRGARIRVAPTMTICKRRVDLSDRVNEDFPLAHPLFVALDLAADPTRGREVLDGWTPPPEFERVW